MSALDRLTDVKSWNHETEDYDAGLPEVKEYDGEFSDVKQAADELASLRAERDEAVALLNAINSMNDVANLNDCELWNVNGEFQKKVDVLLSKFLADPE